MARDASAVTHRFTDLIAALLRSNGSADQWRVSTAGTWCFLNRTGHQIRPQGWKLHLSATLGSAPDVLAAAAPVLLDAGCTFKFARDEAVLSTLNSGRAPRPAAGKFITAYPDRDEDLPALAERLHAVTAGLLGPRILSDRQYEPDSLVHYRYGGFVDRRVLSNDGVYRTVIADPDGRLVDDRREARFAPPEWAVSPFPPAPGRPAEQPQRDGISLADRFVVRHAIRHANKGGVYRAIDTSTGAEVVLKEARPHVQTTLQGRDVRDVLRDEARLLQALAPTGIAPGYLDLFEQSGHVFLAEELVAGIPLRRWVLDRVRRVGPHRHGPDALPMIEALVALLERVHGTGAVLRDLNPNNVMVGPDGDLRLIDLELAVLPAEQDGEPLAGGTPGYSAPEQFSGAAPAVTADYFSLGATLCFVLLGADPYLLDDEPARRPWGERLRSWLDPGAAASGLPPRLRRLVLGLMHEDPQRRSTLADARRALTDRPLCASDRAVDPAAAPTRALADEEWDEAVDGIVGHLLATRIEGGDSFWPMVPTATANDPCNLQHGAAGILGVLARHLQLTGDERTAETVTAASGWICERLQREPERPPGLYFGAAGAVWALHDAGVALGDDKLVDRALELAGALPTSWPNPDLTHGTAGVGLTFLHLAQASGDDAFLRRADGAADALVAAAHQTDDGLLWWAPESFPSLFAGQRSYGFAHGTAGIGYFLLEHAQATGREDCAALAVGAGETLLAAAICDSAADGGSARWASEPAASAPMAYWCHGSAGIGTLLARLYGLTGDEEFRPGAEAAARAVVEHAWGIPLGQCHGAAGNAEFLLDVGEVLDDPGYRAQAAAMAQNVFAQRVYRDGRAVFPGEDGTVALEWASGVAGILAFLLRLRYRSPRMWMAEQ